MDRLTKTLMASLGGGILLGTGLKLGEALSSGVLARADSSSHDRAARRILRRIRHIEARLESFEAMPGGSNREGEPGTRAAQEGSPLADIATDELNPPVTLVITLTAAELPCATETEPGEADKVKSAEVLGLKTISMTECISI